MPVDPSSGEVFQGNLRANVHFVNEVSTLREAPTEVWPDSVQETIDGVMDNYDANIGHFMLVYRDKLVPFLAASIGAVSVVPDRTGFGESALTANRTLFHPTSYAQSTGVVRGGYGIDCLAGETEMEVYDMPIQLTMFVMFSPFDYSSQSWLATQSFIMSEFGGCTVLEDVATVTGYSEGGYAGVPGALALKYLGVDVRSLQIGGVPFVPETVITDIVRVITSRSTQSTCACSTADMLAPLMAYAYSNDFPFRANAGTDQTLASPEFLVAGDDASTDLRQWFSTPQPESSKLFDYIPSNTTELINPLS